MLILTTSYVSLSSEERLSIFDHPSKILKVDVSLNELTELNYDSLRHFIALKSLDASLNMIKRYVKTTISISFFTFSPSPFSLLHLILPLFLSCFPFLSLPTL